MADITLTITKDGLTPSVVDVARAETLSVDFSGMSAWQNELAVESGTVYAQQFDALMRPLGEDAFTLGSFSITLKPGACALDFRVRANATKIARNAVYDINGAFPVKVGGAGGAMMVPCVAAIEGDYADGDTISDDSLAALNYAYDNCVPCIGMFDVSYGRAFPYLFTLQGGFDLSGAGNVVTISGEGVVSITDGT